MGVPNILMVNTDLNITNSSLNQASRHDATPRVVIRPGISECHGLQARSLPYPIHLQRLLAFLGKIQGSACFHLHARCQLIAGYARIHLRLPRVLPLVNRLEPVHQPAPKLNQLRRIFHFRPEIQNRIAG